jgi:hypothetical protein
MRAFIVFLIFSCSRSARCAIRISASVTCAARRRGQGQGWVPRRALSLGACARVDASHAAWVPAASAADKSATRHPDPWRPSPTQPDQALHAGIRAAHRQTNSTAAPPDAQEVEGRDGQRPAVARAQPGRRQSPGRPGGPRARRPGPRARAHPLQRGRRVAGLVDLAQQHHVLAAHHVQAQRRLGVQRADDHALHRRLQHQVGKLVERPARGAAQSAEHTNYLHQGTGDVLDSLQLQSPPARPSDTTSRRPAPAGDQGQGAAHAVSQALSAAPPGGRLLASKCLRPLAT